MPTMTFPHNSVKIARQDGSFALCFDAQSLLAAVSKQPPQGLALPDATNNFWFQKSLALDCPLEYDWTFWTRNQGVVVPEHRFCKTVKTIDYVRLASREEEIRFFDSVDFYEDELSDNGRSICDGRIRVMGFGFFFRLRCFLLVDRVLLRCIESRYYHEFQSDEMLRETRYYEEAYASCISRLPDLHRREVDQIVSALEQKDRYTEIISMAP